MPRLRLDVCKDRTVSGSKQIATPRSVDLAVAIGAKKIHVLETAKRIAERIRDPVALERALLARLEAQREFAGHYHAQFPHGYGPGRGHKRDASSGDSLTAKKYCKDCGFAQRTVQRWVEQLLDPVSFERQKNDIIKYCESRAQLWISSMYSSESVDWYTPAIYVDSARAAMGGIDLDPASCEAANETVKATEFWTAADNPIERDWRGRVFMNPPYGKTNAGESVANVFCEKAIAEYASIDGNVEQVIILVNLSSSQNWQAKLYNDQICLVDHRIQFISGDGEENKNPTQQNVFIYLGEGDGFAREFRKHGYIMQAVKFEN